MSHRTVSSHLHKRFPMLGVTSRAASSEVFRKLDSHDLCEPGSSAMQAENAHLRRARWGTCGARRALVMAEPDLHRVKNAGFVGLPELAGCTAPDQEAERGQRGSTA